MNPIDPQSGQVPVTQQRVPSRAPASARLVGEVVRRVRRDPSHHRPSVARTRSGSWEWDCACGGHAGRRVPHTWRQAVVEALVHSTHVAA